MSRQSDKITALYCRDTSKKIRAVMKSKGEAGEYLCTNPPYGYMKDANNPKQWVVDSEAAVVVKRIFALCLEGYGPSQIARILKERKVITPTIHFQRTGRAIRNQLPDNPYRWKSETVAAILEHPEHQGHTVNFKTYKQSYKSKKTCYNPKEKQLVFEDTHEAIIDADTWERVQELRRNKRRPTRTGKTNLFSGIVRCADCGEKLLQLNEEIIQQEEQAENIDRFICKVRKYLDLDELTPAVLNDMVKAVYVHAPDKSSGHREQQIDISYDLVGILPASLLNDLQNGETA